MKQAPISERLMYDYLQHNAERSAPHTLGTYLVRTLRGRARDYISDYQARILARLRQLESAGSVRQVPSARGRTAWVWTHPQRQ
ncbi:MAG: hypothetical protein KatS3mg087_1077 [Patescibacteria group bacterium]|nr:MAG: hypothetical protein KatS3mg087_1077 [Patescibacteria group bacterium]